MIVAIQAEDLAEPLKSALSALTDSAILRLATVKYDPAANDVSFEIRRPVITGRRFLGGFKRNPQVTIPTAVTVRAVKTCEVLNHNPELESVMLLFGIQFRPGEIYLGSVEEDRGQQCFALVIKVSAFDLELVDVE